MNFSRSRIDLLSDHSYGADIAAELGITGVSTSPIDFGIPLIEFTNFSSLSDPVPTLTRNQTFRYIDNATYTRSKHTLKFGGEARRIQNNMRSDPDPRGLFTFTGLMTSQLTATGEPVPGTGNDLADFLLGLPEATTTRFGDSSHYLRSWEFIGYGQDDWRVNKRFTLEFGARYPVRDAAGRRVQHPGQYPARFQYQSGGGGYPPGEADPFTGGTMAASLVRSDYNNWAPRVGFAGIQAQDPDHRCGGYSIFYNDSAYNSLVTYLENRAALCFRDHPGYQHRQRLHSKMDSAGQHRELADQYRPPSIPTTKTATRRSGISLPKRLPPQLGARPHLHRHQRHRPGLLRAPNRAPPGSPLDTDEDRRFANAGGLTTIESWPTPFTTPCKSG